MDRSHDPALPHPAEARAQAGRPRGQDQGARHHHLQVPGPSLPRAQPRGPPQRRHVVFPGRHRGEERGHQPPRGAHRVLRHRAQARRVPRGGKGQPPAGGKGAVRPRNGLPAGGQPHGRRFCVLYRRDGPRVQGLVHQVPGACRPPRAKGAGVLGARAFALRLPKHGGRLEVNGAPRRPLLRRGGLDCPLLDGLAAPGGP
mmetsp:Transcript_25501/g.64812  ORF Transcript_25501/g.64812 Transcript_25501/m.64812 type:complete len:200 (+) Transcript_25501:2651-3250(+)